MSISGHQPRNTELESLGCSEKNLHFEQNPLLVLGHMKFENQWAGHKDMLKFDLCL